MHTRDLLIAIVTDARGWLEAWAKDFTETEATATGGAPLNPIAWQLGHIASAQDGVYELFTGEPSIVPDAVRQASGIGRPPPPPDVTYAPLAELWTLLGRTQQRMIGLLERTPDSELERPPRMESQHFHTLAQSVYEISLHENYHVGMIGALRKALGKTRSG
jgi:hypothetical protein